MAEGEGEDPEERAGVPVQRAVAAEEARGGDERAEAAAGRLLVGDLAGRGEEREGGLRRGERGLIFASCVAR